MSFKATPYPPGRDVGDARALAPGWGVLWLSLVTSTLAGSLRCSRPRRSRSSLLCNVTPAPTMCQCISEHLFGESCQSLQPGTPKEVAEAQGAGPGHHRRGPPCPLGVAVALCCEVGVWQGLRGPTAPLESLVLALWLGGGPQLEDAC